MNTVGLVISVDCRRSGFQKTIFSRGKIGVFVCTIATACSAFAANFSKGDRVETIKEAPLYFKDTTLVRMARKGEQFTVVGIRSEDQRIFVAARDASGKEIALNLGEDEVALIKAPILNSAVSDTLKTLGNAAKDQSGGVAADLPVSMRARTPETARLRAITQSGGKKESEATVLKGLKWLAAHQNADGSWAPSDQSAMTGFALLAMLGHGETSVSADFGPTVQKAIDWLLQNGQKADGRPNASRAYLDGVFAHGIATFALGEYYTMTKDERVTELLKKSTRCIVEGQAFDGGWQDNYVKTGESDTWLSIAQIQALKAAHLSGLKIEGVEAALDQAMLNLKRVQATDGSFGFRKAGDSEMTLMGSGDLKMTFTGAGVFCTYLWKKDKNRSVRDGIEYLFKWIEKAYPIDYHHESVDLHAWYYDTQACFVIGGAPWSKWNRRFADELIKNQNADGSWPAVAGRQAFSGTQRDPKGAGPCYRTSLCILMLEVFYRYLPES